MEGGPTSDGSVPPDRHQWHEAADRAGFTFFEPVAPGRTSLWSGGFGWGSDEPTHLGVHALIDGVEVAVDTTLPTPRSNRDSRRRLMVIDLLFNSVFSEDSELALPMSIEVVVDDRMIAVAGRDLLFSGVRVEGSERWSGEVEHDGVVIRITSADAPAFSIEPCRNWRSISESPPAGP